MKKPLLLLVLLFSIFSVATAQIQTLQKLSQITFPTTCAGVWHYVDGNGNEYALLGNGDGIVIVDVTDPVNPAVLFTVPAAASLWREIKTYSHYAYAGTEGGGGITIIDLSNLPNSYTSKIYDGDGAIAGQLDNSHTVQVFDDHLYIFGSNLGTVICNLSDPWNPQYVGIYNAQYVHDGYVLNDTMWTSEIYEGQFSVVDVTDKANPVIVASEPTPGDFNHNGWFSDDRNYLYTTDELPNTPLGVFDVSDRNDIQLVATYYNDTMPDQEVHNVRVLNDFLINPSYGSQLTIVDGARPRNLIEIARYHTGPYLCWDASPYLPSGNIIATDMSGEFYVFAPYYVRACYLEGKVTDLNTGLPINGASVKILSTTKNAATDIIGDYRTGYPTAGTFDVEFSKPGYVTKVETGVVLTNGVLTTLDVQLETFSVTVEVTDNITGLGIPFAEVRLYNQSGDVYLTTDGNGFASINSITSSNYEITAGKWGYKSECINVNVGTTSQITFELDPAIYDDFTFDYLWNVSGNALSGMWTRGEPVGTFFGSTPANPGNDAFTDCSNKAFVTGNGGGTANTDDVDDGNTILTSPVFDLTSYQDPYLNYERWFYQQFASNPAINDTLFIELSNGTTTVNVETVFGPSTSNSTWVPVSRRISDYITPTSGMQLIVTISDKPGSGNPLEAGLDKFEITEGPTAVSDPASEQVPVFYPNPFSNILHIDLSKFTGVSGFNVVIYDITGREIFNGSNANAGLFPVNTEKWSKGIFTVRINSEKGALPVFRVVKN